MKIDTDILNSKHVKSEFLLIANFEALSIASTNNVKIIPWRTNGIIQTIKKRTN